MQSDRRPGPAPDAYLALAAIGGLLGLCGLLWIAVAVGAAAGGQPPPGNPIALPIELARGLRPWPGWPATATVTVELAAAAAVTAGALPRWGSGGRRRNLDAAARHMGRVRELQALTAAGVGASARRLVGEVSTEPGHNGVLQGRTVLGRVSLYSSLEDTQVDIWGPRTGKTTSRVIPVVLSAPGAVLTTSNRRDVLDATRLPRGRVGAVWVFDPQAVAGEEPTWWWNPLETVTTVTEARKLGGHFASASRPPDAKRDAFFDPAGEDLLANLLLAAAAGGGTLLTVYGWLCDPVDRTPERELHRAGHVLPARAVAGIINSPEKLRGSVYATALQMAACLVEPHVTRWVTPPVRPLPQLHPDQFVAGTDTLYALSREGEGTAGPLVTALCAAVLEAAERLAARSPRGRLPVVLVAALDEVANVCRIRALPDLYSHYGGRGILLLAVLQSWAQGTEVWGERGMAKLWSTANIKSYGGGVSEPAFLESLSKLIGDRDFATRSTSWTAGTRTISNATRRDRILDVAQLGSLRRGRAVLIASGLPPTLIEPLPWYAGPHAADVRESLARYDPGHPDGTGPPTAVAPDGRACPTGVGQPAEDGR